MENILFYTLFLISGIIAAIFSIKLRRGNLFLISLTALISVIIIDVLICFPEFDIPAFRASNPQAAFARNQSWIEFFLAVTILAFFFNKKSSDDQKNK